MVDDWSRNLHGNVHLSINNRRSCINHRINAVPKQVIHVKRMNNRIDYLISRRNAQFQRKLNKALEVERKYNQRIEIELKKIRRKGGV